MKPLTPYDDLLHEATEAERNGDTQRAKQAREMMLEAQLPTVPTGASFTFRVQYVKAQWDEATQQWSVMSGPPKPVDPLDVEYDGVKLSDLLERDRQRRTEDPTSAWRSHVRPTPAQRAAVSAHWSAELRKRVDAAKERERQQVVLDGDDE